ncbi:MAG: ATP-binding protein [Bryobacterales bacterium]|nr:ATP-binding protein [Bryobacterales bacterium]
MESLPAWARQLVEKYFSGAFSMFILHGTIHDLVPHDTGQPPMSRDAQRVFALPLGKYLETALFGARDIVLSYDRGGGITFATPDVQKDFANALRGYDSFHGSNFSQALPRNPDGVLNILDNYLRLRVHDGKKIAVIINYAETIAPAGDTGGMNADDRNASVILQRWAHSPHFLKADVTIVLVTESTIELNQDLVQHPGVASIAIPLPDRDDRTAFIAAQIEESPVPQGSDVTVEALAGLTSGLKRIQLQSLLLHAARNRQPLTVKYLAARKKEMIEAEAAGMLEFVESKYNLSMVAGSSAAKQKLQDAALLIKQGRTDSLPMGYVIAGPVGTGKTFLATCFAGDVGIPTVVLKNFRSMWQGQTEGNLERLLALLKAMSPIVVIVDEADAQLGDRSSSGDSGVNNRVFAQIAQFMGNTEYRGKVLWFLLTCRPDLLPVDLKRQGRAEEHLALFYPESDEDRLAMFRAMQKKTATKFDPPEPSEKLFVEHASRLSGADIEAILVRSKMRAHLAGRATPDADDLRAVIEDFIPASYPAEIELQNLVAVLECTSKSLLPERYRRADRAEVAAKVQQLKMLLGD